MTDISTAGPPQQAETTVAPTTPPTHLVAAAPKDDLFDIVDEWGRQSFPASDPPSNW